MQLNIHENPQVLQQIEWDKILSHLYSCIHFEKTKHTVLQFHKDTKKIESILNQTKVFEEYIFENDFKALTDEIFQLEPNLSANDLLLKIKKEMALNLYQLNQLALSVEIYLSHQKAISKYFSDLINRDFQGFKRAFQKSFLNDFRKFVKADGEVELSRHPQLRPLYEKQQSLESQIRHKLNNALKEGDLGKIAQFTTIDVINDRYVVPIRSDSYKGKLGQIISRSDSGNTLYVEPNSVANLNFQRIETIIDIQNIIAKLELDLTKSLGEFTTELKEILEFYFFMDEFVSRVRFAKKLNLSFPQISNERGFDLKGVFHPLIKSPIKNDIHLDNEKMGIIISGPNTGGKTATLKTITLIQLFIRYALFVPADFAKTYIYEKVFYFGNDQQDLEEGLSSFSAEVKNYAELFSSFGSSNLILIDEIFNSTSSEEASALAIAFFEQMHKKANIHIIVSSHHQTLKTILHQNQQYISAHVGFDANTNKPTYKIHIGTPGSSHALKIFQKLTHGKEEFEKIYERSLNFLDNKAIHYEKLLESIAAKENTLQNTLQKNIELNKQIKNQKKAMDGVLKLKVQEKVEKTQKKLDKLLKQAQEIIKDAKRGEISKSKKIEEKFSKIRSDIKTITPLDEDRPKKSYENLSKPQELVIGEEYFCLELDKTVTLKRLEKNNKALVTSGILSIKVNLDTLMLANAPQRKPKDNISISYTSTREEKLEYDCRGMRLEEFQSTVEDIIGNLLLSKMPYACIIHGHGSGVLKSWLRKHVKRNKDIEIIPNETGNDGETRIRLV